MPDLIIFKFGFLDLGKLHYWQRYVVMRKRIEKGDILLRMPSHIPDVWQGLPHTTKVSFKKDC